jgi:metallophosphoesterase superfamily enzyme
VPLALLSVCCAEVGDPIVIKLPAVPVNEKRVNVLVVPAVNKTVAGCTVLVIFENVLDPVIVNVPAPP